MASIYLYPKYQSKAYSTNTGNQTNMRSHSSADISLETSRNRQFMNYSRKVYNLNDSQRRIKRQFHPLYQESTKQSQLFEKGLKKIQQNRSAPRLQKSLQRSYRNKQSYNILQPTHLTENHIINGGVKKISLKKQDSKKNQYKKPIKNHNQEHTEQMDYFIRKLPTHQNMSTGWGNMHTGVHFSKKENVLNLENKDTERELRQQQKQNKKTIKLHPSKNKSHFQQLENGIIADKKQLTKFVEAKTEKLGIDFNQDYFRQKNQPKFLSDLNGKLSAPLTYR